MFGWRRNKRAAPAPQAPAGSASAADADALLQRLEWTVVRRLDGLLQGDYRTLLRGFGLDVADLREYRPGDDVRHIDWNATARLPSPHVREFQEDREVAAWFLLDLSGSVDFGSGAVRKRAMLDDFTAVMARLLVKHGNRIGAVLYGGAGQAPSVVPARAGRRHLLHRGVPRPAEGVRCRPGFRSGSNGPARSKRHTSTCRCLRGRRPYRGSSATHRGSSSRYGRQGR